MTPSPDAGDPTMVVYDDTYEGEGGGKAVVVVDPYSTGCCVAQEVSKRGYNLIVVWSSEITDEMKLHVPSTCENLFYYAEVNEKKGASISETAAAVREAAGTFQIAACMCGGEQGVTLNDALSEELGLRTNGTDIPQRRDKKIQQELVKAAGLRSVRQAGGKQFTDVEEFLQTESYPVVVKPVESAGSDGVKLCSSYDEAKEHFHLLMNSQRQLGSADNAAVLCQEFLKGKEYIVDHVSRDGIHKTTLVWVYDKRQANGAAFVYFGLIPIESDSPEAKLIIPYVRGVLDAIGIKNGASHGEVIMTNDGPCLVEMNCRANGGDGNWVPLARALTGGYSQVDAVVDAYLDADRFSVIPDLPPPFKAAGQEVKLVSYSCGTVQKAPGFDVIRQLPSFVYLETRVDVGTDVDYTVDLFTDLGGVILMHPNKDVLQRDVDFIRYMEEFNGFFIYETKMENLSAPRGDSFALHTITEAKSKVSKESKPPLGKPPRVSAHRRAFSSDGPMLIRHMSNDRPELRGPLVKRMTTMDASKEAVVVVDPYSTGALISKEIMDRTYKVIALWSKGLLEEMKTHVPLKCANLPYYADLREEETLEATIAALQKVAKSFRIVACVCGGEAGVALTDALSEKLGIRTNGTAIEKRSDKKVQQELAKAAGLRSVRQAGGDVFTDVENFLRTESYPVVVKPTESAGSDGVKLCHNFNEAKEHFDLLMKSQMVNGGVCGAVLCQEFLKGKEYIVDHVSREGIHKTTMLWVYDKRPANGAAFVYFGLQTVDSESSIAKILIPYVRGVLDALGIKNGATHGEVIMTHDGPCLVEMNCRANGGDGNWVPLARAYTGGYSQLDGCVDAYLDQKQFSLIPDKPPSPPKASGTEVKLVSYSRGTVKSMPGFDIIKQLPSYVYLETGIKVGSVVEHTVDLISCVGGVILMHKDENVLKKDVERIRQMEKDNVLFEYETKLQIMNSPSHMNLLSLSDKKGGAAPGSPVVHRHVRKMSSDRSDLLW